MGVVKNEQDEKRESQFLKYVVGDDGNTLILRSHLYKISFHFLPEPIKRSVICAGKACSYCEKSIPRRSEYNYMVFLNGDIGFIDIKPSVFFAIQGISKAQKKDPRQISWTVIKTGAGLETEYTTSKDDNLPKADYDRTVAELDVNTEKLIKVMLIHEDQLQQNYMKYEPEVKKIVSKEADPGDDPNA